MYLVANWKMNGSSIFVRDYIRYIQGFITSHTNELRALTMVYCPPYPYLSEFYLGMLQNIPNIHLGAQDISSFDKGAHTGEVGGGMLRDCGCSYVLIGHAEKRAMGGDQHIRNKIEQALACHLIPILCVGEKESGLDSEGIQKFFIQELDPLKDLLKSCIVAYEPVWAIGSTQTVSLDHLTPVTKVIKTYNPQAVLYGGGVTLDNVTHYLGLVDGLLVGSLSLIPEKFVEMMLCMVGNNAQSKENSDKSQENSRKPKSSTQADASSTVRSQKKPSITKDITSKNNQMDASTTPSSKSPSASSGSRRYSRPKKSPKQDTQNI